MLCVAWPSGRLEGWHGGGTGGRERASHALGTPTFPSYLQAHLVWAGSLTLSPSLTPAASEWGEKAGGGGLHHGCLMHELQPHFCPWPLLFNLTLISSLPISFIRSRLSRLHLTAWVTVHYQTGREFQGASCRCSVPCTQLKGWGSPETHGYQHHNLLVPQDTGEHPVWLWTQLS